MRRYPDELRADFQQFYGLNLDRMGADYTRLHAAALCVQLPRESRLVRAMDPSAAWGDSEYIARAMEHTLRVLSWQYGNGRKSDFPRPLPTPEDRARVSRKLERTNVERVNRILGFAIGGEECARR